MLQAKHTVLPRAKLQKMGREEENIGIEPDDPICFVRIQQSLRPLQTPQVGGNRHTIWDFIQVPGGHISEQFVPDTAIFVALHFSPLAHAVQAADHPGGRMRRGTL
ncbi:MAG TPA: hypothetical protein DDZ38_06260 [Gammaproteobacteria bacterium]|nr:hypothetical protein [Gammaproteobacteria bacterium]